MPSITICEVACFVRQFRLPMTVPVVQWRRDLLALGRHERMIDGTLAIEAMQLAGFHKDLADRLIVAAAISLGADLLTADDKILDWRGPLAGSTPVAERPRSPLDRSRAAPNLLPSRRE